MKIRVEFDAKIPHASSDDIYDWLRFQLGTNGRLSGDNPLIQVPLEADGDFSINFDVEDYDDE